MFDNKTYNINSPYVNSNTDILYKDRIYDAIYSDNDEFINKIEKITKKSIKKLLISLNGNTGNIYHYLIILQHDYEEQLIIAFKKIKEILNDQRVIDQFINSRDQFGNTPFFYLVSYELNKAIDYFLLYNKDIFNNSITVINESGKTPLDVYLEKDTDYFQMIKNNRENYNFTFSNEISSVSIIKYKNSLNSVFDTNEKIIVNELLYYLQDKSDELNFIKQIYKNTFNIPIEKELKINKNLNNIDYSNIKPSFDDGKVYRYTDLINDYNNHLSENAFEIDKYFTCIIDNKGDIKVKLKNNLFYLFDKAYSFMIKTKKTENIELFNNAIIDTFKNTFNIIETTDDSIKEIFKILKIKNNPINNVVKKDLITIKINQNVFDYDTIINNCKILKILSEFYTNIQTTYNNVSISDNTLTIENNNSSFLSVYAGKLKEKITNNISNSLKSKYDIDIQNDKINFDIDNLIVYNFVNTVNKGTKLYEYQNLNSLHENYENITEIISSYIINKSLNNENLMLKYKKNIISASCLNDESETLKDDNIFEIKKYYLSYYLYYYFYLQKNFFNLFIENFGGSLFPISEANTKDKSLTMKPTSYKSTFEVLYYIYNIRCRGNLEMGKDSNTKKTNAGYLLNDEKYNKNNLIKKIFNLSSFLFFSLDYLFLYNDKTNNNEKTNLTHFLTKDFNFYSLANNNKDYFPAFFYYQLLYFLLILCSFKIQLINQRDYSDYIYSSSSSRFNILPDPINQTAIFIYNRLKYIKKCFESYEILFEFNPKVDDLSRIKEDYDKFYETLIILDDEKLFTTLRTKEIQYEDGIYFTYNDGKEIKLEDIKQLFNYISNLETILLDITKKYAGFGGLRLIKDFETSSLNDDVINILRTGKEEYEKYFSREMIQNKFTDSITTNIITPFFIRDYNSFLTIEPNFTNIYNFSGKGDKKTTFKLNNVCNRLNSFVVQYNPFSYNNGITKDPYYFYYIKPVADYLFNLKIFSKSLQTAIITNKIKSISSFNGNGDKTDIKKMFDTLKGYYISKDNIFDYILSLIISEYKDSKNNTFNFSILFNNIEPKDDLLVDFKTLYFSSKDPSKIGLSKSYYIKDSKDILFSNSVSIYPCVEYYPNTQEDKKINFISHINEFLPVYPVKVSLSSNSGLNSFVMSITPEKDPEDENSFNSKIQIDYSDLFKGIILPSSYFSSVIDDVDIQIKNNVELSNHIEKIYDFYNDKKEIRNNELMKLNLSSLIDLNQYYSDISNFNTSIIEFIDKTKKLLILSIYNNISDYEIKNNQRVIMNISSIIDVSVLKILNDYLKDYKLVRK